MSHEHDHTEGVSDKALLWAVALNLGLTGVEIAAGIMAGSLALIADALHNFNDCATLLIAYIARRISRRRADRRFTFGYHRAELIGAMVNLTALMLVGLYLLYEAVRRFIEPQPPEGWTMIWVAGVALAVDAATAWLLWAMSKGSLNAKAAFVHNLTDAFASIAVILGGVAVLVWQTTWIDPALTVLIAGYVMVQAGIMLKRTATILMEGTPPEVSIDEIVSTLSSLDGIEDVHHLHVWELDEHHRALEAHIVIRPDRMAGMETVKADAKRTLEERFDITHSTLEIESPEAAAEHSREMIGPHH